MLRLASCEGALVRGDVLICPTRPADAFAWEIIAAGVEGELYDWFSWSNANQVETEDGNIGERFAWRSCVQMRPAHIRLWYQLVRVNVVPSETLLPDGTNDGWDWLLRLSPLPKPTV